MKRLLSLILLLCCVLSEMPALASEAGETAAPEAIQTTAPTFLQERLMADLTAFDFPLEDGYLSEYTEDPEREEAAQRVFSAAKVKGGVLIVGQNGTPLVQTAYGVRNRSKDPVTTKTQFRIASVTKLVTAIGLMRLWEAGAFNLDAPLSEYLPMRVANPAFPEDEVTARQLLSHTSSIKQGMRYHPNWESLDVNNNYFERTVRPGTQYQYANFNGGLIGSLIEALSGLSVNSYMKAALFGPLGIDAAYNPGLLANTSDMSDIMYEDGRILSTAKRELETLKDYDDTCDPREHTDLTIGKLYINADGLHRLATLMVNGGIIGERRLLYEDTVRLMREDQSRIEGASVHASGDYGLFVAHVSPSGKYTWYGHQGRFNGITADVFWQPQTGMTFVMIVNGYDGALSTEGLAPIARRMMTLAEEWMGQE